MFDTPGSVPNLIVTGILFVGSPASARPGEYVRDLPTSPKFPIFTGHTTGKAPPMALDWCMLGHKEAWPAGRAAFSKHETMHHE